MRAADLTLSRRRFVETMLGAVAGVVASHAVFHVGDLISIG